jgi:hypothetical protein
LLPPLAFDPAVPRKEHLVTTAEFRDAIFLIGANQLSRVSLQPYESEALLQTLIADHRDVAAQNASRSLSVPS